MIENIDDNFELLMKKLDEWNNTLVIFMTDNGATHLSGKLVKHFNTGLKGAKNSPYQGGNHVPNFWSLQGVTGAGISVNGLTACIETTPDGWEFTREFEYTSVRVNTETREAKITWR